jgi:hypothetical protein
MFTGLVKHASQSRFGTGFAAGVKEGLGFQYGGGFFRVGKPEGFLGRSSGINGLSAGKLMAGLNLGVTAYATYQGFKEGGVVGGVRAGATQLAIGGLFRGALNSIGGVASNPLLLGAGIAAAAGYGYYKLGEAGIAHMKRHRNMEMGSDIIDTFGTMATIRQRSLSAIQNSHVNGRLALGGEAALMHTPMMR